jgi:hypothetical protein
MVIGVMAQPKNSSNLSGNERVDPEDYQHHMKHR